MADENTVLGALDRDVQNKIKSKYDPEKDAMVRQWIGEVLGERISDLQVSLKSGVRLCNLLNQLKPGSIKKINSNDMPFAHRENISNYIDACKKHGMNLVDLFDTQDLYDGKNMVSVINHFISLSGYAQGWGYSGPSISSRTMRSGSANASSTAKSSSKADASISQQSMGSYGVDTGKDGVKLGRNVVRDATQEAKYSSVAPADENETLGSLDRDVKRKIMEKYDPEREKEVISWIESVTGARLGGSLENGLHSGIVLCNLINILFPGSIPDAEISEKTMAFFQRENISKYLNACKKNGINLVDLFDTQDLYDGKNIVSVINHFYSVSSFARQNSKKFKGPYIGVKMSTKNERDFTEEQLNAGKFMQSAQTSGSYGVLDPKETDVKLAYQIVKNVDQIKDTQGASKKKAEQMYGK